MDKYYYALGRRKRSTATLRLYEGKGESTINGKNVEQVYSSKTDKRKIFLPLIVTNKLDSYYFTATTKGGGISGQKDAIVHALSRSLVKAEPEVKSALKKEKLLTRDDRKIERKKTGLLKARKAPQYSKR